MNFIVKPFGEQAILIQFQEEIGLPLHRFIKSVYQNLQKEARNGVVSLIPAYDSITVIFHPQMTTQKNISLLVERVIQSSKAQEATTKKIHFLPVCYELGLDTEIVLEKLGLSLKELISIHSSTDYLIYFLGFVPGFLYLGNLDSRLHIERKQEPRLKIPAGSVALGGAQTGVYPLETPGGWRIIGSCPLPLFDSKVPSKIEMGDYIRFYSIGKSEYKHLKNNPNTIETRIE